MRKAMSSAHDIFEIQPSEPAEWVRGNEAAILGRLAPLVREQCLLLDFSRVRRIDAAGLAALISLYRTACESGHTFAITNPTPRVAEVLAIVGLDQVLLVDAAEASLAVASLGAISPAVGPCLAQTAA
jgi:anti-anti-sigma factor